MKGLTDGLGSRPEDTVRAFSYPFSERSSHCVRGEENVLLFLLTLFLVKRAERAGALGWQQTSAGHEITSSTSYSEGISNGHVPKRSFKTMLCLASV